MISSTDDKTIDTIISENCYPGLTKTRGKVLNYIDMTFNYEAPRKEKNQHGQFYQRST
jgi:hypothetical protein